ncbi:M20 metallopeptidase family protein [Flavisolibacter tropicus]|uniref:M20 metallopeptidase family protein n=1 Tax=Flavisolibacter tropicus TaxID=1492898 RepID=UPI0009EE974D|nr:amidohydrolase [Flavisolibacter tropicus]
MTRILSTLLLTTTFFLLHAQGNQVTNATGPAWVKNIPTDDLIKWRRHIHENAEVSFKEESTSEYVESILKGFNNIKILKPAKTSVVGILKGAKPGKTVAFRADMDALPVQEETGLAFASKNENISHACGHDAHTAMLLATAATLSKMKDQIKGTVYFIFQHAEEQAPGGAKDIIKSGALKDVNAFFGMHVLPNFPAGHIGILPDGAASTMSDEFSLTVIGKGSHGSMPHLGIDPIVIAAEIVNALQTIVSRNVPPGEMAVVTIGKFQAGNAPNVIADKAELGATIRTTSDATRKLVETRIKSLIDNITKGYGATYNLDYKNNYPAVQNDPALNKMAKNSAVSAVGKSNVFDAPMMTASEDFSYYKQIAPEVFLTLGVGNGVANHNPAFNLDEKALQNGVKVQVQIILDYLNQ